MAFTWGVSTAAYQIEGGVAEGGRGPSIWDVFSHEPGRIADGSTGDVDALLTKGIDPVVTLFHWDLPQALEDKGGWLSRDTAFRLADYAGLVADALGDRVRLWITLNEPFIHMTLGDLDTIAAPLDALGVNYYNPTGIRGPSTPDSPLPFDLAPLGGYPTTATGWPVVPDGLRQLLLWLKTEYGDALPPIHVTESGCAYDGIDDPERVTYLDGHIGAMRAAIASGVDVRGYFVWSLMDNFEWAEGYTKRFGLVHIDYETQARTPKTSYTWYRDLVRASR